MAEEQDRKCSGCANHREKNLPERPDLNYILVCETRSTYVTDEDAKRCMFYKSSMEVAITK